MNANGSKRKQLTEYQEGTALFGPSWSSDGKKVLFTMMENNKVGSTPSFHLYIVDTDGNNFRQLTKDQGMLGVFSPDGKHILYVGSESGNLLEDPRLYLMDVNEQNTKLLIELRASMGAWSSDGKRIAFVGQVGEEQGYATRYGIYTMNTDGSNLKMIEVESTENDAELAPQWSSNGKKIYFTGVRLARRPTASIFVMNADGKNVKRLTPDNAMNVLGDRSMFFLPTVAHTSRQ